MAAIGDKFSGEGGSAVPVCTTLISLGADVNASTCRSRDGQRKWVDPRGDTALYWAIFQAHQPEVGVVRLLLKNGADLTLKWDWGNEWDQGYEQVTLPEIARRQMAMVQSGRSAWKGYDAPVKVFELLLEYCLESAPFLLAEGEREAERKAGLAGVANIDSLIIHLKDARRWERKQSAERLGRLKDQAFENAPWIRPEVADIILKNSGAWFGAVDALIESLKDEDHYVRKAAAESLGMIGDPRAVRSLIDALKDEDPLVSENAARSLGWIADPIAVDPLIESLKDSLHSGVRTAAASSLGNMKDPRALNALIDVLKSDDWRVSPAAAISLGRIKNPLAVDPLIESLKDGSESAATALGEFDDPRVTNALIDGLKGGCSRVRHSCMKSLSRFKEPRVVNLLIEALNNQDKAGCCDCQERAAEALGKMADSRAVDALIAALKSQYFTVRSSAALALGQIKDPRAVDPLIAVLNDSDPWVQRRAADALEHINEPRG